MAHFARVGRESLYAMQPPIQYNEIAVPVQRSADRQQGRKQQYGVNMPQKQRKWKKHNVHADSAAAGKAHGSVIHSLNTSVHLAPSLPVAARATPAPSVAPPSPESTPQPQHEAHSSQQEGQKSKKMTRISAYVPPHLRKKLLESAKAPEEAVAVTATDDGERASAGPAQTKVEPVYGAPQAPLSPPSSPPEKSESKQAPEWELPTPVTNAEAQMNEAWGCSDLVPEPPLQPKKRRNGRWPSPVPKGRHIWPKNRDMKPVSDNEEQDDWGAGYKSDSNGDPDYDVKKLIDWNGDWLPPPETWSARHAFTDRHFGASLEKWMNGHDPSCIDNFTDLLVLPGFKGIEANGTVVTMEIAPRNWVPSTIDGDAPQCFWQSFPTRAPPPLSDIDVSDHRPYWEDYQPNSVFLNPIQHLEEATLDMTDVGNSKPGASQTAEQTLATIAAKKQAREKRRQYKLNRPIAVPEFTPRPGYLPTSNVYFRPVVPADTKGIQELYNHYVKNTSSVPEFEPRSGNDILNRIRAIIDEGLPYIVAVQKGFRVNGPQDYVNESIVGFACMEDFCASNSMYRFTFELECYVHPDFLRQNIAKCLLDRLLEMVNTSYPAKGGYVWKNDGDYLKHGCNRVVKVVNCNVPHDVADDMAWMTDFLRKFNFRKAGHLHKMGYKFGKVVDVTVYQHETSENINASLPPLRPL